jgi:hypothetical protein
MKTLLMAATMAAQNPTVDVMIDYPTHTWVGYGCTVDQNMYECNSSTQSFISDIGDVYFVNKRVLYCVKSEQNTLHILDCTNVSGN